MTAKFGWCLDGQHRIPQIVKAKQLHDNGTARPECPGQVHGQTGILSCSCECHHKQPSHTTHQEGTAA